MRDFSKGTAVVTGAASGMGFAFAERFAAEGMNVVLADIETDALKAAVARLEQQERNIIGVEVNTMRRESIEHLREQAIDQFGAVHLLCNNAGVTSRSDGGLGGGAGVVPVWDVMDSVWNWVMGVNFWGVLHGLQVFVPHMIGHGETGHIVNTASLAGLIPGGLAYNGSAYSVSKHGVLTLTEGLWHHLRAAESNVFGISALPAASSTPRSPRPSATVPTSSAAVATDGRAVGRVRDPWSEAAWTRQTWLSLVWQAMVNDQLYILTHPGWTDIVRGRVEAVLDGQQPVEVDFEKMLERRARGELV